MHEIVNALSISFDTASYHNIIIFVDTIDWKMVYHTYNMTDGDAYFGETGYSPYDTTYEANKSSYPAGADGYGYGYGYDDKEKKDTKHVDLWYGALSVGVLTLGLVLIVEETRHRLEHAAIGKPFFASVLDGTFRKAGSRK